MIVYRCKSRFLCSALGRYIPVGATIARYENAIRLVVNYDPNGAVTLDTILRDGIVYEDPKLVKWFYGVEPPPTGSFTGDIFEKISTVPEDEYGNVIINSPAITITSISNLTSNGLVTTSGGNGTLGVLTNIPFLNDLGNNNVRQKTDGTIQFWDYGDSLWHTPVLMNGVFSWSAGEA